MKHTLAAALALLVLAACAPPPPAPPPPAPPPATAPAPAPAAESIDGPLWGPPGTTVWTTGPGNMPPQVLSRTYAPIVRKGKTITPVQVDDYTYLFRQTGDAVYLDGYVPWSGTMVLLDTPRLLWQRPLRVGASFDLERQSGAGGIQPRPHRVVAIESVQTPAGRFPAAVIQADQGPQGWWSPNLGLVQSDRFDHTAQRLETGPPMLLPAAFKLDGQTTAFLTGGLQVIAGDGRMLLDEPVNTLKLGAFWADVGGSYPIVYYFLHSQAEPNALWKAFAYNPERGRYEAVPWHLPEGREKARIGGNFEPNPPPGTLRFRDDEHYPLGWCTFRWSGGQLACAAYEDQRFLSEEPLFARLVTRPLDEASWAGIFADPAQGRAAFRATRNDDGRNLLANNEPVKQADGAWLIDRPWVTVRYTLVRHGDDWRVATWELHRR